VKLAHRLRHAGFTLVELMISMALGLLIILALVMMLGNVNRNNSEMSNTNRIIESGRFAAQLLAADLSHTGYWGGYVPNWDSLQFTGTPTLASSAGGLVPTAVPDPCADYATWTSEYRANLIGIPVQSSDIVVATAKPFCDSVITSPKTNSDVLVVRHAETCVAGSGTNECANTLASANPNVYFQTSTCETDTESFVMSNAIGAFTLKKRAGNVACGGTADIRRLASSIYYVKDNGSSGAPVLMRSVLTAGAHGTAQELVEGVEAFRVEFGIDSVSDSGGAVTATAAVTWANASNQNSPTNRGDGIPDGAYVHCTQAAPCTPYQMMNAVSARIYVLVRGERASANYTDQKTYNMGSTTLGPFGDGYKRHLFTQTVRFMNISGRRETP
jgi:type IV pilus assembly protein PilW